MWTLELDPALLNPAQGTIITTAAQSIIPECEMVIITGSALINKSLEYLLESVAFSQGVYRSARPEHLCVQSPARLRRGPSGRSPSARARDGAQETEPERRNARLQSLSGRDHPQGAHEMRKTYPQEFDKISKLAFAPIYPCLAKCITKKFGVSKGVCVDVGSGPGSLAIALARITNLNVYSLDLQEEMTEVVSSEHRRGRTILTRQGDNS